LGGGADFTQLGRGGDFFVCLTRLLMALGGLGISPKKRTLVLEPSATAIIGLCTSKLTYLLALSITCFLNCGSEPSVKPHALGLIRVA
jgi:hypothetical protein